MCSAKPRASSVSSARMKMISSSPLSSTSAGSVKSVKHATIKLVSSLGAVPAVSGCRPGGSCWPSRAWSPTCQTTRRNPPRPWPWRPLTWRPPEKARKALFLGARVTYSAELSHPPKDFPHLVLSFFFNCYHNY